MLLADLDGSDTADVLSSSDHGDVANVKLAVSDDLAGVGVDLDGIVHLDRGVRVTDGASIVGDEVRDTTVTDGVGSDGAELHLRNTRGKDAL